MIDRHLIREIYDALQAVADVLSKVKDEDWNKVACIMSSVNEGHTLLTRLSDEQGGVL